MANPEHLAIVKQGVEAWNRWRSYNRSIVPDLSMADLNEANLEYANLSGANLSWTKLSKASLVQANISHAYLIQVRLVAANLRRAYVTRANLSGAELTEANLQEANLSRVNLDGAYMANAILRRCDLTRAYLGGTYLRDATLDECRLGFTAINDTDFSQVRELTQVHHQGPSSIGTNTLIRTLRGSGGRFTDEQTMFFKRAGVPPLLLEYLSSILETAPLQFYSCFISYSTWDEDFATQLTEDLNTAGVRTWKWNMDAIPGRELRENIDVAIRHYDKLILICSVNSLTSKAVDREIETALQKEERLSNAKVVREKDALLKGEPPPYLDTNVLVPIRLDNTVFNWTSPLAPQVRRYYIPDFSGAEPYSDKYRHELQRLIEALNPSKWPPPITVNLK